MQRVMSYIDKGKKEGATLHHGGERHGDEGFFIQPTIFTDVKPGMAIHDEEIFGPVVSVAKFKDEDGESVVRPYRANQDVSHLITWADIVRIANDTTYGLAAAVFSRDISRAIGVAHRLQAGTIWVRSLFRNELEYPC